MLVFHKLEKFYKENPRASHAVKAEVEKIRAEFATMTDDLQKRFDADHQKLTIEYMERELEYLESWLSPDEKVEKELPDNSWWKKAYSWLKTKRPKV